MVIGNQANVLWGSPNVVGSKQSARGVLNVGCSRFKAKSSGRRDC